MKAVVLGTGSTIGTLGLAGGVAGFVNRLKEVRKNWSDDWRSLAYAVADCEGAADHLGLDVLWTRLDFYSKFKGILGDHYSGDTSTELQKAILSTYSFTKELQDICNVREHFTLKTVIAELGAGDALISFNWDTLVETLATHVLGLDLVQVPYPGATDRVRLIKPHGSLSWEHQSGKPIVFQDGHKPRLHPMAVDRVYSNPHESLQPLILGAMPIKSELLAEIQNEQPGLHGAIVAQWVAFLDVLTRADEIVVVGYRFPPEDAYGRFLCREATRKRPTRTPPSIRYYALASDRVHVEAAFREVFSLPGAEVNYQYCGMVEPAWPKAS